MPEWNATERKIVEDSLKKILSSTVFEHSPRQQRLLSYLVAHSLAPRASPLKGYTIGVEVFDRDITFDPSMEPIVRVEAARLRNKLREYYADEGSNDVVFIELPKGGYHLQIDLRTHSLQPGRDASAPKAEPRPKPPLSFAVLPFSFMGDAPHLDALAYGLGESLIAALSRWPGLHVLSRKTVAATAQPDKSAAEIGDLLGVRYLIDGSIQAVEQRACITVQLVDTGSGNTLCAERFERTLDDVFALQNDIAKCVMDVLRQRLSSTDHLHTLPRPDRLPSSPGRRTSDSSDWHMAQVALDAARSQFLKAVECDPGYAAAHALLARTLLFQWCLDRGAARALLDRALQHKRAAIALNRHHAFAHGMFDLIRLGHRHCHDAVQDAHRALQHDPGNAGAALLLSLNLSSAQMPEEAYYFLDKARSPLLYPSPHDQFALGQCHYAAGDLNQAESALKRCSELSQASLPLGMYRITCLELLGSREEEAQTRRELRATLIRDDGSMMIRFSPQERRDLAHRSGSSLDRRRPWPING
jgi:TolB-like protein/Tfp pilus assembly protein PilF